MQQTLEQIKTNLELEHGHPVIIVPGTRNVVFVVPGELEAYKLAYHLFTTGTRCSLAQGLDPSEFHVTCSDLLIWQVGDHVEWTVLIGTNDRTMNRRPWTFQGRILEINGNVAKCLGQGIRPINYYRDDEVKLEDLRHWKPNRIDGWEVGDEVRWQYKKQDGTIINFVGTITNISNNGYATCDGQDEATGDDWIDNVLISKLRKV